MSQRAAPKSANPPCALPIGNIVRLAEMKEAAVAASK